MQSALVLHARGVETTCNHANVREDTNDETAAAGLSVLPAAELQHRLAAEN